jgi:D-glycero-alpha-D-manno-heptose-7-phosphate kinase
MFIRSKAPLRISFAGGGTDVMPYAAEQGGVVLSTTINHYAYASLRLSSEPSITMQSLDYDMTVKHSIEEPIPYDGNLDLIKAVINRLHLEKSTDVFTRDISGIEVFMHSDAPPGSGLGSSSTLVVALIALFKRLHNLPLTDYEIADLAYQIERVDMGIKGGKQDQYAATFGGFNFIEFNGDTTIVNPLRINPDVLNELNYNLLLSYTGKNRLSSGIIDTQIKNYMDKNADVISAMNELKSITVDLKNSLLRGRLGDFGNLLNDAWLNKKKMAAQISTPMIDDLYSAAMESGALGGKITGAGGGGYMFFYCPFGTKRKVAEAIEKVGAQVVEFNFDSHGVQTWKA